MIVFWMRVARRRESDSPLPFGPLLPEAPLAPLFPVGIAERGRASSRVDCENARAQIVGRTAGRTAGRIAAVAVLRPRRDMGGAW